MKLLFIGIDGLRPDCLLFCNANNIKKLLKKSKYTFDGKISTSTISGPSWSCILLAKKKILLKYFQMILLKINHLHGNLIIFLKI